MSRSNIKVKDQISRVKGQILRVKGQILRIKVRMSKLKVKSQQHKTCNLNRQNNTKEIKIDHIR